MPYATVPADMGQLADRAAIIDLVSRMGLAADARDWDAVRACFADRVRVDYASLTGEPAAEVAADDLVVVWRGSLPGFDRTQHLIANHQVALDGDRAACLSHFRAEHRIGDRVWELDGDYDHRLVRRPEGWRIAALTMTWTFERGDRALAQEAATRAKEASR